MVRAERQETVVEKRDRLIKLNRSLVMACSITWKMYFKNESRIMRAYEFMSYSIQLNREIKFERDLRFANHGYHIG